MLLCDDSYTFGEIYYSDASTPQSIPTGVTYTKWTAFATNGASSNVTNDAANDKIILTEAGIYQVTGNFSTSCDTDSVLLHTALFVNGTEKANIHKYETFLNQNNSQSGVVSGIITITTADLPAETRYKGKA